VGLSNQAPDVEYLEPMVQRIGATAGALPDVMTADAGYWSEANAKTCAEQRVILTLPPAGCPAASLPEV
jgi:hypothetical protein